MARTAQHKAYPDMMVKFEMSRDSLGECIRFTTPGGDTDAIGVAQFFELYEETQS